MNPSIILILSFVAFAAAIEVPVQEHLDVEHTPSVPLVEDPDYYKEDLTVSKSHTVGQYPYHHKYPLHHIYGSGYYPYQKALYGQYGSGYPYQYSQYGYGYPHQSTHYGYGYPHQYSQYGYGYPYSGMNLEHIYGSGYPYYHGGYQTPYHQGYWYGQNYPVVH